MLIDQLIGMVVSNDCKSSTVFSFQQLLLEFSHLIFNTESQFYKIMIFRKTWLAAPSLLSKTHYRMISHKFYFGQGGELQLDLRSRTYSIAIETIWDDYSLLEIEGLTGCQNFTLHEQEGISYFKDEQLQNNESENISVTLKVPQDYTLRGTVNGSITHGASAVGKKMRSKPFELELTGKDHSLTLGDLKSQSVTLVNRQGLISMPSLTVQEGKLISRQLDSKKIMTSSSIQIKSNSVSVRSIIMFGRSHGHIHGQNIELQSISGSSSIVSSKLLKIDRYYGGENNINIKCKDIKDKLGIETGTGRVQFDSQEAAANNLSRVILGRMHKGGVERKGNVILIC